MDNLVAELRSAVGGGDVLSGDDVPARNAGDWSGIGQNAPLAVVRPLDAAGVSATLRLCGAAGVPVVPQGGLTGLCRGATPEPGWIALSLERMTGIEDIDATASTMTVRAGTPLEVIQQAADAAGLFFPLDLGARGSCAIGGNLSTNAGGNRVIRYGMTRELVLGIEVVLPDGTIITSLNKLLKNNAGYDLKHLFIGSEGTLGVITRAVLRLFPRPKSTMAAFCACEDYEAVLGLLKAARTGVGPLLSAFEVMWPDYWEQVIDRMGVRPPVSSGHGGYVLIEAQGTNDEEDQPRFEAWLEAVMEQGLLTDAAISQSVAQTQSFWAVRDACSEFVQALGPHISYDVGLETGRMDEFAGRCKQQLLGQLGAHSLYYGHAGDGNLHLVSWVPGRGADQPKDAMDGIVYNIIRDMGGSISAEHGIGTLKKKWLPYARGEADIALMRTLKQALDPKGILNPGKVV